MLSSNRQPRLEGRADASGNGAHEDNREIKGRDVAM